MNDEKSWFDVLGDILRNTYFMYFVIGIFVVFILVKYVVMPYNQHTTEQMEKYLSSPVPKG